MTMPLHIHLINTEEHSVESVMLALLELHLDEVWLRLIPLDGVAWGDSACLLLELFQLQDGQPMVPETLGVLLSQVGRRAVRLYADKTRTSLAFEYFFDGESRGGWAGNVAQRDDPELTDDQRVVDPGRMAEAVNRFAAKTTVDLQAVLDARELDDRSNQEALPGSYVLLRGRYLRLVPEMGRWPEMFRFHDRDSERNSDQSGAAGRDHMALVGLDLQAVDSLWKLTPCGKVYQFLRLIEPLKVKVLGPLGHAVPEILARMETLPPEAPLASLPEPDLTMYEILAMSTALIFMVGDEIGYLDNCFFPLLSLSDGTSSMAGLADSLADIVDCGVFSALAEVLPYSVPEGEILEAFDDQELLPLASWAVHDGAYEGSIFLLEARRLKQLIGDFQLEGLKAKARAFHQAWHELVAPAGAPLEQWLAARQELDEHEGARFEDTFVELQHLMAMAELNNLTLALFFYTPSS